MTVSRTTSAAIAWPSTRSGITRDEAGVPSRSPVPGVVLGWVGVPVPPLALPPAAGAPSADAAVVREVTVPEYPAAFTTASSSSSL